MGVVVGGDGNDVDARVVEHLVRVGRDPHPGVLRRGPLALVGRQVAEGDDLAAEVALEGGDVLLAHPQPDDPGPQTPHGPCRSPRSPCSSW